jgi:dTDP-4-dehydrorhamnose reductase
MILVTGSNGQLGFELKKFFNITETIFTDRASLDISSREKVSLFFEQNKIRAIVNCAAYTLVDQAEENVEMAYLVNEKAVVLLGEMAKKYNIPLVHISTDYVFNGNCFKPLHEDDVTGPKTVYGKSKLAGELKLLDLNISGIIIRTSWLYSEHGNNFVKTILKYGQEREKLNVVYDQVGSPTNAFELAQTISNILPKLYNKKMEVYHFSCEGAVSWYDFAIALKAKYNFKASINPIESHEYPTKTPRPHYSVLSKEKIKKEFNMTIPHWLDSLNKLKNI